MHGISIKAKSLFARIWQNCIRADGVDTIRTDVMAYCLSMARRRAERVAKKSVESALFIRI